jgi:hypothetical protein
LIDMFENGTSSFSLFEVSSDGQSETFLETQTVLHDNKCIDNYYEGTVDGLYFGGNHYLYFIFADFQFNGILLLLFHKLSFYINLILF